MKTLWDWFLGLFIDEYIVTIYFPGDVIEDDEGVKRMSFNPKEYCCRRVKVLSEREFKLFTTDGRRVHVKTVEPVGFDIIKIR